MMKFLKILALTFLLASCVKCVSPEPTTPTPDPIVDTTPHTQEAFVIYFSDEYTLFFIKLDYFGDIAAFSVTHDGIFYGMYLWDDPVYLPAQKIGEKVKLEIISLDSQGKEMKKSSWNITRN